MHREDLISSGRCFMLFTAFFWWFCLFVGGVFLFVCGCLACCLFCFVLFLLPLVFVSIEVGPNKPGIYTSLRKAK